MKNIATKIITGLFAVTLIAGIGYFTLETFISSDSNSLSEITSEVEKLEDELGKMPRVEKKAARGEYFRRLLRDPATGEIPPNIRSRELNHARTVPSIQQVMQNIRAKNPGQNMAVIDFNWQLAGPPAIGGRTRALGIDQRDSDVIIAGGISGGIWKSTDAGANWDLKTADAANMSVTSLAQDPTNPDTWYYVGGEFQGNSASDRGFTAPYYGTGIFRSTDNGETWNRIPGTEDDNTQFDSQFDYVNRIIVNPQTGTVFVASNGFGVFRSEDGSNFNNLALGGLGEHFYADVAVAPDGRLVAVLSSADAGTTPNNPGVYVSDDDGQSWDEITPSTFPDNYFRSVITVAPSDSDIIYVFTQKDEEFDSSNQGVDLHKIDLSGGIPGSSTDLSGNLPDYGEPVGRTNLQGGYNMVVSVKPDDPDFVFIGGTNLFRSRDGFSTSTSDDADEHWIGGYAKANNISQYPQQHPDQHVIAFDPSNPNAMWVGHDGGLSYTSDLTAAPLENWEDKNEGYYTTQFYDVSISSEVGDDRLMGGTQDNGTPYFRFESGQSIGTSANDISSGDGAHSFFTDNYIFVSSQRGRVIRWPVNSNGDINGTFAIVQPSTASDQLFIHPYAVDPNDETVMYYPGGNELYRNTEVDEISDQNNSGTTQGWERLNFAALPEGSDEDDSYNITALEVTMLPNNTLYYGGSSGDGPPEIRRLQNASNASSGVTDISIPDAPSGAYLHDIAVNPANGNELLAVMSNYNIIGLYHSTNGGNSWEAVEGNLTGVNDETSPNPGPSLRSATIISADDGPIYVLGTSTGIYATQQLDGDNTQWGKEAGNEIGDSVVENLDSRLLDGDIAVGSHGRGLFLGDFQGTIEIPDLPIITSDVGEARPESEITLTATNFSFSTTPANNEVLFGNARQVPATVTSASATELTVEVPRNVLERDAESRDVQIRVTNTETGSTALPLGFTILPPQTFTLEQNYPNPFNPSTVIPIDIPQDSRVTLQIYDITGQKVREPIFEREFNAGAYNEEVDFSGLASGVYIYRIILEPLSGGGTLVESQKLTFVK